MTDFTDPSFDFPANQDLFARTLTKRLLAFFIDTIIIALISVVLIPFTAFAALLFLACLISVIGFIYRVTSISNRSATPGMRMMGIEFRNHHGERLSGGTAFMHTLLFTLMISTGLPQLLSIIVMLTSERGQGLADHFLGTVVINTRS